MTSFIIVSKDKNKRDEYLKEFYKKYAIDVFDQAILTLDNSVKQNSASIGIEDIKQMQKKIFLKPLKSKTKAVILEDAELLTIEAQNALLKVLEEPPEHTLIVLSTNTKETLLPTIISRCHLVQLEEEQLILSEKEKTELQTFLEDLPKWGIGERLKKAEQLAKDKNKAIEWIEKIIFVTREKMLNEISHPELVSGSLQITPQTLRKLQSLHTLLKTTNTNPRFAIENTLLQLT